MEIPTETTDPAKVLAIAVINTANELGLKKSELAQVMGIHPSKVSRLEKEGLSPKTKEGEIALILIRVFRALYALMGGDEENIKHWMRGNNKGTGGIPAEQIKSITGLNEVVTYVDAMRGRA